MTTKYPRHDHNQHLSDIDREPQQMLTPIQGYDDQPLVSLEEAVEPIVSLVPEVRRMTFVAKAKYKKTPVNNLSVDQSAAIILYSMEWQPQEQCLYHVLNQTLRTENRKKLKPWFLFLRLILTALSHLPSAQRSVFRGIKRDIRAQYPEGETVYWWGFSSCTTNVGVLKNEDYLGRSGVRTIFAIECFSGKDVRQHSNFEEEAEILLPPGRQFQVVSCLDLGNDLSMIQLRETEPAFPLLGTLSPERYLNSNTTNQDINILLLGGTGIGKSTFINALANYLVNDTFTKAVDDEIQAPIPAPFCHMDPDTFDVINIQIGEGDEYEQIHEISADGTRKCRSFVFTVGDRLLRLIDTPPIGGTRGFKQDIKDMDDILSYIARYEYLSGICIFVHPNQGRLDVLFRYTISELLRRLPKSATANLICTFTKSRSTMYRSGSGGPLLNMLFRECRFEDGIQISCTKENTFLIDNEGFRYLAIHHNGIQFDDEYTHSCETSWNHTVKESARLIAYIATRGKCPVRDIVSLYTVQQVIRVLTVPIIRTSQYTEQAMQLTKEYKKSTSSHLWSFGEKPSANNVQILFRYPPRLVCTNPKCTGFTDMNGVQMIEYTSVCYERCYFSGNVIGDKNHPSIKTCAVMDQKTGGQSIFLVSMT